MATITVLQQADAQTTTGTCRFCGAGLHRTFVDLGMSPLCETYPSVADLNRGEVYYPLHVYICEKCWLVQLEQYESAANIFSDYPYFSSYSESWLKHAQDYSSKMAKRFALNVGMGSIDSCLVCLEHSVDGLLVSLTRAPEAHDRDLYGAAHAHECRGGADKRRFDEGIHAGMIVAV